MGKRIGMGIIIENANKETLFVFLPTQTRLLQWVYPDLGILLILLSSFSFAALMDSDGLDGLLMWIVKHSSLNLPGEPLVKILEIYP